MSGVVVHEGAMLPTLVDLVEVERWGRVAKAGDRIVYARGTMLPRAGLTVEAVREMSDRGEVMLLQRKQAWGYDYIALRRAEVVPVKQEARLATATDGDDAFDRVMRTLKRAANLQRVCPTNGELAKSCGLKDADAAAYLVRLGVQRGIIAVTDRRPKRRVVKIVASGRVTLED